MLRLGKPKPLTEHEAHGEIEQAYHEIRQVLRVSGINLNFRTWAGFGKLFPGLWTAIRPNAGTAAFETSADALRSDAVRTAQTLARLQVLDRARLGESQRFQIRAALALYHYINPKLLVLTSAVRLALNGEQVGGDGAADQRPLPRGIPERMYAMEMVEEEPDDPRMRQLFEDIKNTLSLSSINSDYRTLALWPAYLEPAWNALKPVVIRDDFRAAADRLRENAREHARRLPYPVGLTREHVRELGEDDGQFVEMTHRFEQLLPALILNIALLSLDSQDERACLASPFPISGDRT